MNKTKFFIQPGMYFNYRLKRHIITVIGLSVCLAACNNKLQDEAATSTHTDVKVTHAVEIDTSVYREFQGTTQFIQHLQIRAQTSGIISQSFISVSKRIEVKQPLFVIKSREAVIINSASGKNNILSKMADTVFAFSRGIIDKVIVQPGDFVQEGDLLATLVNEQSMRVVVSVPLEEDISNFRNKACEIIFPNGKVFKGKMGMSLPIANNNDQTNQFLVIPESVSGLSENTHVRVRIKKLDIKNEMFVPKSSVYSNEELTRFWVLKVIHDSIALRVPVTPGVEVDSLVQLINSPLQLSDYIIWQGGYALPDSALVNIIHSGVN